MKIKFSKSKLIKTLYRHKNEGIKFIFFYFENIVFVTGINYFSVRYWKWRELEIKGSLAESLFVDKVLKAKFLLSRGPCFGRLRSFVRLTSGDEKL